jgi:large subunit ribosomal protein L10
MVEEEAKPATPAPHHGHSHIRKEKEKKAEALKKEILKHRVVALAGFRGVPASNMQSMRRDLHDRKHYFRIAPNSQFYHALKAASKERPKLSDLEKQLSDQTAILLTDSNPFGLYKELQRTKSKVPPKGGEKAPQDIWAYAGETSFKPGPIVAELQHAGFPAAIEKGKVVIKKDTIIVKKGEVISREVAQMLTRLDIKPLEVGLLLRAAVEEGFFYTSDALAVDFDAMLGQMVRSWHQAMGVAMTIGYLTPETLPRLIIKSRRQAMQVALSTGFISPETVGPLMGVALRQAHAIKGLAK